MFHWSWKMEVFYDHWDLHIPPKTVNSQASAHKTEIPNHAYIQLKTQMDWEGLIGPNSSTEALLRNYDSTSNKSVECFSVCHLQAIKAAVTLPTRSLMREKDDAFIQKLTHKTFKKKLLTICFWLQSKVQKVIALSELIYVLCFFWEIISLHSPFYSV